MQFCVEVMNDSLQMSINIYHSLNCMFFSSVVLYVSSSVFLYIFIARIRFTDTAAVDLPSTI